MPADTLSAEERGRLLESLQDLANGDLHTVTIKRHHAQEILSLLSSASVSGVGVDSARAVQGSAEGEP